MLKFIINFFRRIRNRHIIAKSQKAMEPVVNKMIRERKQLRQDINVFLHKFFNTKGKSKFIPANYKNSEEVRIAILDKFSGRMADLNVTYNDLFR